MKNYSALIPKSLTPEDPLWDTVKELAQQARTAVSEDSLWKIVAGLRQQVDELTERNRQLERALGLSDAPHYEGIALTPCESNIVHMLESTSGVCSLERLCLGLTDHNPDRSGGVDSLRVHISRLRKKLEPHGVEIESKAGEGYYMVRESKEKLKAMKSVDSERPAAQVNASLLTLENGS